MKEGKHLLSWADLIKLNCTSVKQHPGTFGGRCVETYVCMQVCGVKTKLSLSLNSGGCLWTSLHRRKFVNCFWVVWFNIPHTLTVRPIEWQSTSYSTLHVSSCDLFLSTGIRHKLRYAIPEDSGTCVRKETFLDFMKSGTCQNLSCLWGITDRKL
jgi:hypothetical protein